MKEIKLEELNLNPFTAFGKDWMALSAGNEQDGCNSMTVSWGHLGIVWDDEKGYLPTAIVYVRPQRYTKKFMDSEEYFTLSYLGSGQHKPLGVLGTKSGRDCDKYQEAGVHPVFTDGTVYLEEAKVVFICRKIYQAPLKEENFIDKNVCNIVYPGKDFHDMYVGEIVKVLAAE